MRTVVDEMSVNVATMAEALGRASLKAHVFERLLHMHSAPAALVPTVETLLDIALDTVPAEAASLMLVDAATGDLVVLSARGPVADKVKGLRLKMDEGIAGVAALHKQILPVSEVNRDPRFAREIAESLGFPVRSLIAVPILHQGSSEGVIELINRKGGDEFMAHEIDILEKLGRAAGVLLAPFAGRT